MIGFWLKALTRPTVDLTLATHAGLVTRIVERPGAVLNDADLAALVAQLRSVAGRTLDHGALTYGVFSGERERLSQTIVTLITEKESGKPIAFNALAQMRVMLNGDQQEVTATCWGKYPWPIMEAAGLAACPISVLADWPTSKLELTSRFNLPDTRRLVNVFRIGLVEQRRRLDRSRLPVEELIVRTDHS